MNPYLIKSDAFSIHAQENICYISFSSVSTKNAISLEIASEIKKVLNCPKKSELSLFQNFLRQENCVLVVVRSLVKNIFASGGHLKDLFSLQKGDESEYGNTMHQFCKMLSSLTIPSITLLSGNAYGGGVELAVATDFRWSIGTNIEFHFTQTKFGVPGGWRAMIRLNELNPYFTTRKVNALFLSQDIFSFEDLVHTNLIDKKFEDDISCLQFLNKWRDNILSCDETLRQNYSERNKVPQVKLEKYDIQFFKKFFLKDNHKKCIQTFLSKQVKNK